MNLQNLDNYHKKAAFALWYYERKLAGKRVHVIYCFVALCEQSNHTSSFDMVRLGYPYFFGVRSEHVSNR
jgi:hypothetical protein